MGHDFEVSSEITVDATPEQVWDAIATGPGIDSWFMGRNGVEPGEGGVVRTAIAGMVGEGTITAWDPPRRFAYRSGEGDDGSFHAFEFLVEGRAQGSTVVRLVHNGVLAGDDWATEYDALREGDPIYLRKLGEYLTYFPGRTAFPVEVFGPNVPDRERAWELIRGALGLTGPVAEGEQVRLAPAGLALAEGIVDVLSPSFLGVRTSDGLYRFIHGYEGSIALGHHIFADDVDPQGVQDAWQAWANRLGG